MAGPSKASLVIETILKEKGLLDLKSRTDKIEESLGRGKKTAEGFDSALTSLGKRLLAVVSVGALANFGKSLLTEFAAAERGINSIRHTMRQLGIDAEASLPRVIAQIKEIVRAGDVEYGRGLTVFEKLLGLTHSTEAAQFLLDLSWKLSEAKSGTMDLAAAADFMASVLQGKAKQAARDLGIQWDHSKKGLEENIALFEAIIQQYGTFGAGTEDAADKVDRLAGSWAALRLVMSETIGPRAAGLFDLFGMWLTGIEYKLLKIERWWYQMKEEFAYSSTVFGEFFASGNLAHAIQKGYEASHRSILNNAQAIDSVNKRMRELQSFAEKGGYSASAGFVDDWAKGLETVRALLKKFYEQSQEDAKAQTAERERKRLEKEAEDEAKDRAKAAQEEMDAVLEGERRQAQEIADIIKTLPPVKLSGDPDEIKKQEAAIQMIRELGFQKALELAKTLEDQKANLRDQELFALQKVVENEIAILREAGATEIQIAEWVQYRKGQIDDKKVKDKKKTAWIENEWERREGETTQQARARVAMQVFENTKAGALARAFINLYQGISAIWAEYAAFPPIAAALTAVHVAMVYKQIQAIRKQKYAVGFDDPYNDRAAYFGGRKWGADMIGNWTEGVSRGWQEAMAQAAAQTFNNQTYSTVYNQGHTIHLSPTYLGDSGLRMLYRDLGQIGRAEQARKIR